MIAQAKLLRVLQLITQLKQSPKSIKHLSDLMDCSERTAYRYIELLQEVGFVVDQDFHNRYFIHTSEEEAEVQFSIEEASLLRQLIEGGANRHPLKDSLLKKLSLHSALDKIPEQVLKLHVGKLLNILQQAMENKKQVVLKDYHSANSQEVKDRLVEPFQLSKDYQSVIAFDVEDKTCKHFKLERCADVLVLEKDFAFTDEHKIQQTDMFGMSGSKEEWISLKLSLKAYVLLREEFPRAISYVEKRDDHYFFQGPVYDFKGIGRFVLGLMDEINVIDNEAFKNFLADKLKEQKLLT
ncbi:MAG TPA: WYL domain-containing protein [Cyclobacteriaceae bacterium]|nr:WYL domain-containing protein [Cyclobacteriaceae bacterium]